MEDALKPLTLVVGLALVTGVTVAALTGQAERLRADVASVMKPIERAVRSDSLFVHIDTPPAGVARGMQLGLLTLLLGGVPVAIAGRVLLRYSGGNRFAAESWSNVFHAGLVFQLSSVGLSAFFAGVLVWAGIDASAEPGETMLPDAGALMVIAGCGAWAVPAWRRLRSAAEATHRLSVVSR